MRGWEILGIPSRECAESFLLSLLRFLLYGSLLLGADYVAHCAGVLEDVIVTNG